MDQCVHDSINIPATPGIARFGWRAALLASTALLAAAATPASAQTTIWIGGSPGNWYTAANWTAGVPGPGTNAAIGYVGYSFSATIEEGAATVGGKLDIGFANLGYFVVAGGTLTTGSSAIGTLAGITGSVMVSGSGTRWINNGSLSIGEFGKGDLYVRMGGLVTTGAMTLGLNSGASGLVTVGGGSLASAGDLVVGHAGEGTLYVSDLVTVGNNTFIGKEAGSQGTVIVDGASLISTGSLLVGDRGHGILRVGVGGLVRSTDTVIGMWDGSSGEVIVGGAGSTLTTGALRIGTFGSGKLVIIGGRVTSNADPVLIGAATVEVSGTGILDASTIPLHAGFGNASVINIQFGGTILSRGATLGASSAAGSSSTVTAFGADSTWSNRGDFVVGDYGNGTLRIAMGGQVANTGDGFIARQAGSTGAVSISGAVSTWTGTGWLITGAASSWTGTGGLTVGEWGAGVLTLADGGRLVVPSVQVASKPGSSGTLVIGAAAGQTAAAAGILDASTVTFGSGSGTIVFNHTDAGYLFSAEISGNGTVNQLAGTTILTGANTYTGGTTIASGATLQIGNGGTSGSVAGDVANNGTLVFARADASTFGSEISGAGNVLVRSGIVAVTGNNTHTGGTTIASGATLQIGNGGASGAVAGNIAALGTLILNLSSAVTYGGVLSGNGLVRQVGSGSTMLTGDSSGFAGNTRVEGGILSVNGRLGGTLTVLAGGQLQGTGTISDVILSGTVAPGNSIGTLNVGNITFQAGSIYQVEVNAAGQSDKIVAMGTATINGGTVQVLTGAGTYAPSMTYTILTAVGGRTGTFSGVTSNFAFLDWALTYDPNNVYLTLSRNAVSFPSVAGTFNQRQAGAGVESLGAGNPVWNAVVQLSAPMARAAFDQLSGEVHASTKTALYEDSRLVRDGALSRLRSAFGGGSAGAPSTAQVAAVDDGSCSTDACQTDSKSGIAAWAQGFGSWGYTSGNGNAAGLSRSTGGVLVGVDAPVFEVARLGLFGGYSHTNFNVADRQSSGNSDNVHLGAYGGAQWGPIGVRAGLAYTWHNLSTSRSVAFPGFADSLRATYGAGTFQVFGEAGYRFDVGAAIFEPFANIAYMSLTTKGFSETGGAAALTGTGLTTNVTATTLGLRAGGAFTIAGLGGSARGTVGWQHAFTDTTPWANLQLTGGTPFTAAGVPIAQDAALLELGIDLRLSEGASIGIGYTGQFAAGAQDQSVRGNFTFKF